MKKLYYFTFIISLFLFASNVFATEILKKGTVIPIKLKNEASSKQKEQPNVVVAEDVLTSNGVLAIKAGTSVGFYWKSDRARACGHPGTLSIRFETTRSVNGMKVPLDMNTINKEGKDRHGLSIGLGTAGIVIWPLLPCYLIRGKNTSISEGTVFNDAYVAEDVVIEE